MRLEEMPRIVRRGREEKAEATADSKSHPFNADSPWDWAFKEAATKSTVF